MKKIIFIFITFLIVLPMSSCGIGKFIDEFLHGEEKCIHDYKEVEGSRVESTCSTQGTARYQCSKCQEIITKYLDLKEHDWNDWTVTKVVSCTENGSKKRTCKVCNFEEANTITSLGHNYQVEYSHDATCTASGVTKKVCSRCSDTKFDETPSLGHDFTNWIETSRDDTYIYYKHSCTRCTKEENKQVLHSHLNNSLFAYNPNQENLTVSDEQELKNYITMAIFNHLETFEITFVGEVDANQILADVNENYPFDSTGYSAGGSVSSSEGNTIFHLTFNYREFDTTSTPTPAECTQIDSMNANLGTNLRSSSYDDFAINSATLSYPVSSNEQLFICLEYGVKPLPVAGSKAETSYNKLKNILRNICSDTMSDYEKVKAIHDYLIQNVTYDYFLLENIGLLGDSTTLYKSFYIDGVLDEGLAVCEGIAKTVVCLCNIEGIGCVMETGKAAGAPENAVGHAWNKVLVDAEWYILDATHDQSETMLNGKRYETANYVNFLTKERTDYIGVDFTEIICTEDYDMYQVEEYHGVDLYIESIEEFNALLTAIDNNLTSDGMLCIKFGSFNPTSSEINLSLNTYLIKLKSADIKFQSLSNCFTLIILGVN